MSDRRRRPPAGALLLVPLLVLARGPAAGPAPPTPAEPADPAGIEWVRIEGGTFGMGSDAGSADERPVHRVRVATFELARTEVTVAQYRACVAADACAAPDAGASGDWVREGRDDHPVTGVDWDQAQAFAAWAGGRLPSEAEWEYAARGGGRPQAHPWGDEAATCARAVMDGESGDGCGRGGTWPVCSKPAGNSAQGVCDLVGNVWEWVEDAYHETYVGAPGDGRPWLTPVSAYRVLRGGSWGGAARHCRAADRGAWEPGGRFDRVGFRVARSVSIP